MAGALILAGASGAASAADDQNASNGKIDVLNWWTSGAEAKSMGVLGDMLAEQGVKMNNDAVSGGGGGNARTVLKSRIQSHNIPGAAQIKGPKIQQWCRTGLTGSIDSVAKHENWDDLLAPRIAKSLQCDGQYVAVPFNIHRINWLWINRSLMDKANIEVPKTWDDFVAAMKQFKQAGITPIAGGGNTWQVATELDAIAAATGDAEFYRQAFVELDPDALSGDTMVKSLQRLRTVKQYSDPNASGLSWNHDTGMVVKGEAAMQIMGDWAKGEITNAGVTPGKQVVCTAMPGSSSAAFVYNVDTFEMFKVDSDAKKAGQKAFAKTAMSPEFQRKFNLAKGSIPVREEVSLDGFDPCAKKAAKAYKQAKQADALLPSFSQDMAEIGAVKGAIFDVIAKFYNSPNMSAEAAAQQMAARVKQAQQMSKL